MDATARDGTTPEPLLLTVEQAAEVLGVTRKYLYDLTARGELPHLRIGRYLRFRRESLERWVAAVEQVPEQMREQ